jgi:hypothetical protein
MTIAHHTTQQSQQTIEVLAAAANKTTYAGAGIAAVGGMSASDIAAFGGLALAAAGFLINTFFRWRDDRRAQAESHARMRMLEVQASGFDDRRQGLPDTRAEPAERRQGPRRLADETT